MALIDYEGFEGITSAQLARRGWSLFANINGNAFIDTADPLFGQYMRVFSNHSSDLIGSASRTLPNMVDGFVGCSYRRAGAGLGERTIYELREGGTTHLTLTSTDAGQLRVYRGTVAGTLLQASSLLAMPVGDWTNIEIGFIIDDAAGSVEVRVEESPVLTFVGDTKNGGTGYVDTLVLRTLCPFSAIGQHINDYDDFYFCDSSGADNNDFLGPRRVDTMIVLVAIEADFTPSAGANEDNVDDGDSVDDDATYNETAAAAANDLFSLNPLPDSSLEILAVKVRSVARRTDAGPTPFVNRIKSGAVVADGATHNLGAAYGEFADIFERNPDGDVAWDDAAVNALLVGYATP